MTVTVIVFFHAVITVRNELLFAQVKNTKQQYSAIQSPDNYRKKIIYQHRNQSIISIHITGGQRP